MKKNECAQEMILDLVRRHGCSVTIRPSSYRYRDAIDIVISQDNYHSSVAIDLNALSWGGEDPDECVCRMIERTADELFRAPYREMMDKHFHKENE